MIVIGVLVVFLTAAVLYVGWSLQQGQSQIHALVNSKMTDALGEIVDLKRQLKHLKSEADAQQIAAAKAKDEE